MPSLQSWLVAVGVTVFLLAGCTARGAQPARPPSRPVEATPAGAVAPFAVLRQWDRARADAYATADPEALGELYVTGSAAGAADVRLLRDYRRRGLRVEHMRMQVLASEVELRTTDRVRLRVTDRLVGAVVVGSGVRRPLPRDRASTRVVELSRGAQDRWRVVSVSGSSAPRRDGR